MSFPIGKAVLDLLTIRLADSLDGFNATYNDLKGQYGISKSMAIDFQPVDGTSKNFCMANVTPEAWVASGSPVFPFVSLFVESSANQNRQKFHQFSGEVRVGLNVFLSWKQPKLVIDAFEAQAGCVEETVYTVLNRSRNSVSADQEWSDEVTWNADVSCLRSRVERGAEYWAQALAFKMIFEVDQRGEV